MAITFVRLGDGAASKVSGSSLVLVTSTDPVAGNLVVLLFAMDNAAGTVSVADDQGNTWTSALIDVTNSGGVRTCVFASLLSSTITGNITVSHPSVTARAARWVEFAGVDSSTNSDEQTATGSADPATSSSITPSSDNHLVIQVVGLERDVSDIGVTNSWGSNITVVGTTGGGAASNICVAGAYEIQTTATARGVDWNFTTAGDWAVAVLNWAPTGVVLLPSPTNFGAHAIFQPTM